MKKVYEILNAEGIHLCYQVATTESQALNFARIYGYPAAMVATFIRRDE